MSDTTTKSGPITGRCLCGEVSYTSAGSPVMAIECYCADCQKLSGATRLPQLAVPRAQLVIAGPVNIYKTKADSGMDVECGSCCRCGSLIYKASSRFPDQIFLAVGCFDDLSRFEPGMKVYMDGQPEWDKT